MGGGLGGFAAANRLHALLDGAKITLIDPKEEHNDQPGYTLVAMDAFRRKGVNPVLTLPAAPLKCAAAPLKMTFMQREHLAQSGTLGQPKVTSYSAQGTVFGVGDVHGTPRGKTAATVKKSAPSVA